MRALIVLSLCAISAAPLEAATAARDDIVVTGKRETHDEIRDQARQFIRETSAIPVSGQFARWHTPICVKTIGLAKAHAQIVTDKIRAVAREADVAIAKPACETNVLIVFTADADRDIADLKKLNSRALGSFDPEQRRLLAENDRPVRWWYLTNIEGADGIKGTSTSAAALSSPSEGGATGKVAGIGDAPIINGYGSNSLIKTSIRATIDQAIVIVDANAASGKTLSAVAAYAAMVTLARVQMDEPPGAGGTILRLFSGDDPPPSDLSAVDRAFLTALYRIPADREAWHQRRQIATAMAKMLEGQD